MTRPVNRLHNRRFETALWIFEFMHQDPEQHHCLGNTQHKDWSGALQQFEPHLHSYCPGLLNWIELLDSAWKILWKILRAVFDLAWALMKGRQPCPASHTASIRDQLTFTVDILVQAQVALAPLSVEWSCYRHSFFWLSLWFAPMSAVYLACSRSQSLQFALPLSTIVAMLLFGLLMTHADTSD